MTMGLVTEAPFFVICTHNKVAVVCFRSAIAEGAGLSRDYRRDSPFLSAANARGSFEGAGAATIRQGRETSL